MNLYLISQNFNSGWDTYDSAVVVAENEEQARNTQVGYPGSWADPEHVEVELIGNCLAGRQPGVVLGSFNAG